MVTAIKPMDWQAAWSTIRTGDILLCRKTPTLMGRAIERVTGSQYVHAAMAGWTFGHASHYPVLMQGETVGHNETRLIDLWAEVSRWPGLYDVYRVHPELWGFGRSVSGPEGAWTFMRMAAGSGYSWRYCWWVWLHRRIPRWLHWLIPSLPNSDDPTKARDCSGLVHAALRSGGGPQIKPHDWAVVPGDLSLPKYTAYIGTLFASSDQYDNTIFTPETIP
jgi:hypothetical protein